MLLNDFFDRIYLPLRLRGRSQRSTVLYRLSIKSFSETLGHQATLDDLTDLNVSLHMSRVRQKGRAAATANKDRAQLLAMWRLANRRGLISTWPDVPEEVEPQRTPVAWLSDELDRFITFIRQLKGKVGENDEAVFWESLVLTALDTGERIGALMSVEWKDLKDNWLRIPAEVRKGGRKDRAYCLGDDTLRALKRLKRTGNLVFPWPYNQSYLWIRKTNLLKQCGLPHDRKSKFHRLRKTTASAYHAAGHDAMDAMGHSDRKTTEAYLDPRFMRKVLPSQVMGDFLKNSRRAE